MHVTAWLACHLFFTILEELTFFSDKAGKFSVLDIGSYDYNGNLRDCIRESNFGYLDYVYTGFTIIPFYPSTLLLPGDIRSRLQSWS